MRETMTVHPTLVLLFVVILWAAIFVVAAVSGAR